MEIFPQRKKAIANIFLNVSNYSLFTSLNKDQTTVQTFYVGISANVTYARVFKTQEHQSNAK